MPKRDKNQRQYLLKKGERMAGRKIAPVLSMGGDGFGNSYGAFEKDMVTTASEPLTSDHGSVLGSPGLPFSPVYNKFLRPVQVDERESSQFTSPGPFTVSRTRDVADRSSTQFEMNYLQSGQLSPMRSLPMVLGNASGLAAMRPSPARTPVTISPSSSSVRLPTYNHPELDSNLPPTPPVPIEYNRNSRATSDGSMRPILSPGRHGAERSASRMSKRSGRFTEDVE